MQTRDVLSPWMIRAQNKADTPLCGTLGMMCGIRSALLSSWQRRTKLLLWVKHSFMPPVKVILHQFVLFQVRWVPAHLHRDPLWCGVCTGPFHRHLLSSHASCSLCQYDNSHGWHKAIAKLHSCHAAEEPYVVYTTTSFKTNIDVIHFHISTVSSASVPSFTDAAIISQSGWHFFPTPDNSVLCIFNTCISDYVCYFTAIMFALSISLESIRGIFSCFTSTTYF